MNLWTNALAAICIGQSLISISGAAELIVMTNQGATPGVRELAAGFARASGHKVTVLEESGDALQQRINAGPAIWVTPSTRAAWSPLRPIRGC